MKKTIITIVIASFTLIAILSLTVVLIISGNNESHSHTYESGWSFDEINHWHKCEGENCTEVIELGNHIWNKGEITVKPTADENGVQTYTCTVCGAEKEESVEFVGLDESEWEALASPELYTNFTLITTQIDRYFKTENEIRVVDGNIYITSNGYDPETNELKFTQPWGKAALSDAYSKMVLPDLKDFDKIEYDEENDVYRYTETFEVMDVSDPNNPKIFTHTKMEWSVKDGRIWQTFSECWYIDDRDGRVDVTLSSEYFDFEVTVAPIE